MTERQTVFLTVDFYNYGQEAGKAWYEQYQKSDLAQIASEIQHCTYHLSRNRFPPEIIDVWVQGFRKGVGIHDRVRRLYRNG